MPTREADVGLNTDTFYRDFGAAIDAGAAAVFAGAGLSRPAGYVDWRGLLADFAAELGLDIDTEPDLVAVAQYHLNANNRDRSRLNQRLAEEFSDTARVTASHQVIARLPIRTLWTSNYDRALERAYEAVGKRVQVIAAGAGMTVTRPGGDAVLHKMHGDADRPEELIITRDDYERYAGTHGPVLTALQADLTSKTFLFLGFSFADPNLGFLLGRLRAAFGDNPRTHYTIMRRVDPADYRGGRRGTAYRYARTRQRLRVEDLRRYGIQTVLVDDYAEIPQLLEELERRYYRRSIFVAGAAADFAPLGRERLERLCHRLGARIVDDGYNLVSGFGVGVGSPLIMGALDRLYREERPDADRRLRLRPFPQTDPVDPAGPTRAEIWRRYRTEMVAAVGFAVFVAGNKVGNDGESVVSNGMIDEYEIARAQGRYPIPLGATGWAAREIWERVAADFDAIFPSGTPRAPFDRLGDASASDDALLDAAFALIHRLTPRTAGGRRRGR